MSESSSSTWSAFPAGSGTEGLSVKLSPDILNIDHLLVMPRDRCAGFTDQFTEEFLKYLAMSKNSRGRMKGVKPLHFSVDLLSQLLSRQFRYASTPPSYRQICRRW